MPDIDPQFIDVDFEHDPRYVFGDRGANVFGHPSYEQRFGALSDAEIRAAIEKQDAIGGGLDLLVTRIFDQRQEGSCVANATAQACEIVQSKQLGTEKVVHLSAISLYKRIGSGPNTGAMVSDGLKELSRRGILPLDNAENRAAFGEHVMANTGYYTPFPSGWETTAAKFKSVEAWPINTVPGLLSALLQGHPVVVGRQGHSICYVRPMLRNGEIIVRYANSWSENWSDQGFGYDSSRLIQESARWAFALRATVA